MDFLLVSGPQSSGKTSQIKRLYRHFTASGYAIVHSLFYGKDFRCILEKNGRYVLMQSDTDLPGCIKNLKKYYASYPHIDVIITACRNDPDHMRNRLFNELSIASTGNYWFEIPLGRMPSGGSRTRAIAWYEPQMDKLAFMAAAAAPFYL